MTLTTSLDDRAARTSEPAPSHVGRAPSPGSPGRLASRGVAAVVVVAVASAYGALAGWWTPRGPNDSAEALAAMAIGLAVGVLAGGLLRSRWAMVLAPLVFVGVFELVRLDATGATVDQVSLSSEYGVMALMVGRAVHSLVALLPMAIGVAFGRRWATRGGRTPSAQGWRVSRVRTALGRVSQRFADERGVRVPGA